MGHLISALINFFLEIGRSGEQYKTRRSKSQATMIILITFAVIAGYGSFKGFGAAYFAKVEVVRMKKKVAEVEATNENLFRENSRLQIRNEILSNTLSLYIGKQLTGQINEDGATIADKKLPPLDPDTDVMLMPNNKK